MLLRGIPKTLIENAVYKRSSQNFVIGTKSSSVLDGKPNADLLTSFGYKVLWAI